jgi:hypothetical protein
MRKYFLAALITFVGGILAHAQTLDQREQCAADAKRAYEDGLGEEGTMSGSDWGKPSAMYRSHYNVKTGKCLMHFVIVQYSSSGYVAYEMKLVDANEHTMYATYSVTIPPNNSITPNTKVYNIECSLYPDGPSRDKGCKTMKDFDAFVDAYMSE